MWILNHSEFQSIVQEYKSQLEKADCNKAPAARDKLEARKLQSSRES